VPQSLTGFTVDERRLPEGISEVAIAGEVDLATVDRLAATIDRMVDGPEDILLDLTACDFIDSSGLALLVRCHQNLAVEGRRLILHGCRGQVERILQLTELDGALVIQRDRSAGLSSLATAPDAAPQLGASA